MKRALSLLLAFSMALAMLTGCGGNNQTNNSGTSGGDGSGKPFEGQELTVLYMSGVYADAARAMVPAFEEATGATVEVVDFPYVTLHEKALLDLTSGGAAAYDVIDVASQWDGEFAPFLTDLGEFIERDNYDMDVWIENVLNNCGLWQGTVIGIPNACTPQVFAYRTDLLPDGIPDTWEEYLKVCQDLTKDGMYGATISELSGQLGGAFDYVLWSMGGNWADEDWNVTIDSPETRAALEHMYAMNKTAMDPANLSWGVEESIKAFLDGRAAVCETWPTLGVTQNADNPEKSQIAGKWALDLIPHGETGITLLSAWDVAIPQNSEKKDLAWEWVKMYTSAENQQAFYDEFAIFSPRTAFWEQDAIKDAGLYPVREALDTANMWWRIAASVEADTVINTTVGAYLSDQISLEDAIKQMDEGLKTALKNAPPEEGIKNYNH